MDILCLLKPLSKYSFIFYRIIIKVTRPFSKNEKLYYFSKKKTTECCLFSIIYLNPGNIWPFVTHIQLTDLFKARSDLITFQIVQLTFDGSVPTAFD